MILFKRYGDVSFIKHVALLHIFPKSVIMTIYENIPFYTNTQYNPWYVVIMVMLVYYL